MMAIWPCNASERSPNFLIILADDLGFSDIGAYGSEIATPRLDGLAASGLLYTQFYSTARCWPTRAALLTGYYAQQIGRDALPGLSLGGQRQRPAWAPLLPNLLKGAGYRSYHSGKWHIDGTPAAGGFDRSYVVEDHDRHLGVQNHTLDGQRLPPEDRDASYYTSHAIAEHAIEFLKQHQHEHSDKPFFQYLAFLAPHFPLHAPQEDIDRYRGRYDSGWDAIRQQRWERIQETLKLPGKLSALEPEIGPPYDFPAAIEQLGPGEVNRELTWSGLNDAQRAFQAMKMEIHAAMVDRMDREIGRVIDLLREIGELENTVIFFLSDNGCSAEIMIRGDGHDPEAPSGSNRSYLCIGPGWSTACNTPFRRHKVWVHEGGIASPLIIHWPKGITRQGEHRQALGHVIDIAPTVVELALGKWPEDPGNSDGPPVEGRSLANTFRSDKSSSRDHLWWEHEGNRALRCGDWKIVAAKGQAWELYNLAEDRAENHDLAATYVHKVQEMEAIWQSRLKEFERLAANASKRHSGPAIK